jgi:hypothetical protein
VRDERSYVIRMEENGNGEGGTGHMLVVHCESLLPWLIGYAYLSAWLEFHLIFVVRR